MISLSYPAVTGSHPFLIHRGASVSAPPSPPAGPTNVDSRIEQLRSRFCDPDAEVAALLCDDHPADGVALTTVDPNGRSTDLTYGQVRERSIRCARALEGLGVGRGDRVASLMDKSPDLVVLMVAVWRLGAVYVPLFTAFAPQAIALRLEGSDVRVIVVDPRQRTKLVPGDDLPDDPDRRIVVTGDEPPAHDDDLLLTRLEARASSEPLPRVAVGGSGALVHMFTSGTTGKPKGVVHPVAYLAGWQGYLEFGLGVTAESVYWCAADPGWAYGLYSAIAAPLAAGRSTLLVSGGFSVERTWRVLAEHQVTDFTAAPTVYRGLRSSSVPVPGGLALQRLSSAGEPLTPEVNEWAEAALGLPVHDHFGQTEVGMVLANCHHPALARLIKPGSMGRAIPGWQLTVLAEDDDAPAAAGALGRVAVDVAASPMMTFTEYQTTGQAASKFTADRRWYLTGDSSRVDDEGYFFFSSRDDDVIIMAGYRIGPFEIESVLAQHPAVVECVVVAAPDEVRGEVIEAHVVLRDDTPGTPELVTELQQLVKTRYAAHAYPRAVHFHDRLPKTPSGKLQRYLLRDRARPSTAASS
ncbi:AMP-binding protein [Cryptosporangium sp. NPDC051539]|uniref:AMP-binding protein n=1 Tax=Cryptosporangium sp. NPDC051539 TaxID=3363962 RepID=UPI0037AF4481